MLALVMEIPLILKVLHGTEALVSHTLLLSRVGMRIDVTSVTLTVFLKTASLQVYLSDLKNCIIPIILMPCPLLNKHDNLHIFIASSKRTQCFNEFYSQYSDPSRIHFLGWIDTKRVSPCLDIYLDSFPRGSCNTIFEAVQSQVPFCIMDTSHNRESLLFHIFQPLMLISLVFVLPSCIMCVCSDLISLSLAC